MNLNRRDFIKSLGAITATPLFLGPAVFRQGSVDMPPSTPSNNTKTILYDSSKCTGCHSCEAACREWNHIPEQQESWTLVKPVENPVNTDKKVLFGKYQCMHCADAACIKVCPTGALTRHPSGFVAYDINKCSGCGYCMQFCPFKAPYLEGNAITGIQQMHKCTFCEDRLALGKQPACVEACPTNALVFGNRSDMLNTGKARIISLYKNHPDAVLYGESELNGLQVVYILLESPDVYGLPDSPEVPAATLVWKDLIQPLGFITAGLLVVGLGLNYIIARANLKDTNPKDER
jgi:formate dehydrogenase iron-sulfur subunit